MSATLFSLRRNKSDGDQKAWNNQNIADFYRAIDILKQAGLNLDVDSGFTDEGDPWFVFFRPESGEVVAHFAQIDGEFLAVSALNQQVYRGQGIRDIVDKMLQSHPLLLPQKIGGGKLLLHPTAAISAFLAAAFILTIDGVKASNISEVIFTSLSENKVSNETTMVPSNDVIRPDAFKTLFSDIAPSNLNVAVLGAALIADELFPSVYKPIPAQLDASGASIVAEKIKSDRKDDDGQNLILPEDQGLLQIHSLHSDSLQELGLSAKASNLVSLFDQHQPAPDKKNNKYLGDDTGEGLIEISGLVSLKDNTGRRDEDFTPHADNNALITTLPSVSVEDVVIKTEMELFLGNKFTSENVSLLPSNSEDVDLMIFPFSEPDDGRLIAGFELTFDPLGEVKLVASNSFSLLNDNVASQPLRVSKIDMERGLVVEAAEIISLPNDDMVLLPADAPSPSNETVNPLTNLDAPPIIGHDLKTINKPLRLDEAVDVVFYQGGDAVISGFELGTDLLWFFISKEELLSAESTINTSGDLVLDFGVTGTLTFLAVVPDNPFESFV